MNYIIFKDGVEINVIYADESFVTSYCEENGYTYQLRESTVPHVPTPAQLREEAYNTQTTISFDGELLTVTQASQKWQYYAAEGNTIKPNELTELIAEAKAKIREQYPDE